MTTRPRGCPRAWRTIFAACSFASAPPSVKKTRPPSNPDSSSSRRGERGARLGSPGAGDETKALGLVADRGNEPRMLVTQVAALGEAAQIEDLAAVRELELCAAPTNDGGRGPVGLHAPAVQDHVAFGQGQGIRSPKTVRIAHIGAYCAQC